MSNWVEILEIFSQSNKNHPSHLFTSFELFFRSSVGPNDEGPDSEQPSSQAKPAAGATVTRVLRSERERKRERGRNKNDKGFEDFVVGGTEEGLERRRGGLDEEGWGVYATRDFYQGDYVCQYKGDSITKTAAGLFNAVKPDRENYQVWVTKRVNGRRTREYVVDASPQCYETTMGRNINHHPFEPNLCPRYFWSLKYDYECVYFLCGRDIKAGEEISWDYNDCRTGTTLGSWAAKFMERDKREYQQKYRKESTADKAEIYYSDGKVDGPD